MEKYKLLMISDIPLANSGVGTQTKYIIDHLVKTGKFKITCLGGAVRHQDYKPIRVNEWGEDVLIIPVDGYGNKDIIRQALDLEKIDCLWIMTDPRFYTWLFQMSDEIKQVCPLIYWNLWDNADELTWPRYNKPYYDACTKLPAINKLTYKFLKENGWAEKASYIPHGVPQDDFKILDPKKVKQAKLAHLGYTGDKDPFVLFYNSRNAIRKRTGTVLMAFKEFLNSIPAEDREHCFLTMKTPPKDPEGQDLFKIISDCDLSGRVAVTDGKFSNTIMAEFYNMADATISLSSEEGFGLSILESLMCGTPVICTKTGGMQDQAIDDDGTEYGFCLEPDARSLIGSQTTPYIWSDHVNHKKAAEAIHEIYRRKMTSGDHKKFWAGQKARDSALRRFSLTKMCSDMENLIVDTIEEFRTNKQQNKSVRMVEV